jgi:tetratricopeptide (TPR) repeat protein
LGNLYAVLSLYEKAVEALDNAVALSNDAIHLIALGEVYGAWGNKTRALEYFHEALSANPKRVDCYLDIADSTSNMQTLLTLPQARMNLLQIGMV